MTRWRAVIGHLHHGGAGVGQPGQLLQRAVLLLHQVVVVVGVDLCQHLVTISWH